MNERPWLRFYGDIPASLEYPETTLHGALAASARRTPLATALDFFGTRITYANLLREVDRCAAAFARLGLARGDRILIALPTCPQGVIAFYAANRLGAVPAMVHPLSTSPEIAAYARACHARVAVGLDAFHDRLALLGFQELVLACIPDYLSPLRRAGFWLTRGRRIPRVPREAQVRWWRELLDEPGGAAPAAVGEPSDAAAILFSGGTTGAPKAVVLSNANLLAEGLQVAAWARMQGGDSILAILPIFHGFGLGVCINAVLMGGGTSILVPTFAPGEVAKLVRAKRPSLLVGVPTLFDALSRDRSLAKTDLSCVRAAFSGADTLPRPVKERFEALVAANGGSVRLLEGYGLTEAVSAVMAIPPREYREGSIGIPFPDMDAAVCRTGTTEHLPPGEKGEICIRGPTVMSGYLGDAQATAEALRAHEDGRVWLHTGDLGHMDADGFFYFTCRLKRMIKSSGFNVYPAQVEAVLYKHPAVKEVCVIGVPDSAQIERVRAVVVPKPEVRAGPELADELVAHCRKQLIKWSCPREIEFRDSLPLTRLGKVDYRALMEAPRQPGPP